MNEKVLSMFPNDPIVITQVILDYSYVQYKKGAISFDDYLWIAQAPSHFYVQLGKIVGVTNKLEFITNSPLNRVKKTIYEALLIYLLSPQSIADFFVFVKRYFIFMATKRCRTIERIPVIQSKIKVNFIREMPNYLKQHEYAVAYLRAWSGMLLNEQELLYHKLFTFVYDNCTIDSSGEVDIEQLEQKIIFLTNLGLDYRQLLVATDA